MILGYGEDAFTLWALKQHTSDILESFQDKTVPSDCLIFYRPSFGRRGGKGKAIFREFDAILISSENIYLIESKWDNLKEFKKGEIDLQPEQKMRHRIFSWYITHWDGKYSNWKEFMKEQTSDFQNAFPKRKIAPADSLLATNLQFILATIQKRFKQIPSERNIKNVLLFFFSETNSTPPNNISKGFKLVEIDYSKDTLGNFVKL